VDVHKIHLNSLSSFWGELQGHSRNTIRKVLQNEISGYQKRAYQPFPVLQGYMHLIDSWLEDDKEQHSKQRHTARRIYHRLIKEHGYQGSEPTVRRYVRQAKARLIEHSTA
jgi:hypothetical protein